MLYFFVLCLYCAMLYNANVSLRRSALFCTVGSVSVYLYPLAGSHDTPANLALREVEEQVQSPYYSHTTTILFLVISMLIVIINIFINKAKIYSFDTSNFSLIITIIITIISIIL